MAAPRPETIRLTPGRIAFGVTAVSGDWPYTGGTGMGMSKQCRALLAASWMPLPGEDLGGAPADFMLTQDSAVFTCLLRGWDNDAVARFFHNSVAGSPSGDRALVWNPIDYALGALGSARATSFLFTPDDPIRHESLYFPNAIPIAAQEFQPSPWDLERGREKLMGVSVYAAPPNDFGKSYYFGKQRDLPITSGGSL